MDFIGHFSSLTSSPDAWWVGQFVGFLLRYNERVGVLLRQGEESIDFSSPVVGVHVRYEVVGVFPFIFEDKTKINIENCDWKSKAFLKRNNVNEFISNQSYKLYCRRTDKIGTPGG